MGRILECFQSHVNEVIILTVDLIEHAESFLHRYVKLGYTGQSAAVADVFLETDDALFRKILYDKALILT